MNQGQDDKPPERRIAEGLGVGVGGTAVGAGIVAAILSPTLRTPIFIFLAVALLMGLAGFGLYLVLRTRRRQKRGARMADDVTNEFNRQAASSNDHDQKVRLEEMKQKFLVLINRLRAEGHENIYEMPWFLTMGPSGTGKSWVLKGSGLEPLTDDEWKKGTFLLDWWSCADALVLDTAGGVVFAEEKYDTPEWASLLKLLKQHRPQCPLNGVLVVVPAQLLWLKPSELPPGWLTLEEYAERLRTQLRDRLQRALGVRFPVYFLVTQSDRIPGFREFADALDAEGKSKTQMLGWSNALRVGEDSGPNRNGSDARRDPEFTQVQEIARHLGGVAEKVRRQRLTLLETYVGRGAQSDPVGMEVRKRAADLFSFADAIQTTLAPRLQELIAAVFKPDNMLPRPPYLRGVYFTSAMREGEVLDRQLARLGGRSLGTLALPGGVDTKQPNPFFLKDLVFKKAFVESWLVTPLVDARAYLQQRRRALYLSGIGATAGLLLAIGIGGCNYVGTVGGELEDWKKVEETVRNHSWIPVVNVEADAVLLDGKNLKRQQSLARAAGSGLRSSGFWSFRWLFRSGTLDGPRRAAQLKLFERGVIGPMAGLVRQRLVQPSPSSGDPAADLRRHEGALLALLELELATNRAWASAELIDSRDRVFDGLVDFLLPDLKDERAEVLTRLKAAFDDTYSDRERRARWSPALTRDSRTFPNFVDAAFDRLGRLYEAQSQQFSKDKDHLVNLLREAGEIRYDKEQKLMEGFDDRDAAADLSAELDELKISWQKLVKELAGLKAVSFTQAFTNFSAEVRRDSSGRLQRLRNQLSLVHGARQDASPSNSVLLPVLDRSLKKLTSGAPQAMDALTSFDEHLVLATAVDGDLLVPPPSAGAPVRSGAPLKRALDQRLESCEKTLTLPIRLPRRAFDTMFEEVPKGAAESIDGIIRSAAKDWGDKISTNGFAGLILTNTALTERNHSYAEVLSQYFVLRHFTEKVLTEIGKDTSNRLASQDEGIRTDAAPDKVLAEAQTALGGLKILDGVWDELRKTCRTYGGSSKPRTLSRVASLQIAQVTNAIHARRVAIAGAITRHFLDEQQKLSGTPWVDGRPIPVALASSSMKRAVSWSNAVAALPLAAGQQTAVTRAIRDEWSDAIRGWLGLLAPLVDERGRVLAYRVTTPWGKYEEQFKRLPGLKPDALDAARLAAQVHRDWKFDTTTIDASKPGAFAEVSADRPFNLAGWTTTAGALGKPVEMEVQPRSDGWTIIALVNRRANRTDESPPWFVPITLTNNQAAVWFVIEPVKSRDP